MSYRFTMIGILLMAICGSASSLCADAPRSPTDEGKVNALWNESLSTAGDFGFWLYPIRGHCPYLRAGPLPLVFGIAGLKSKFTVTEMQYCFQLGPPNEHFSTKCLDGYVELSPVSPSKKYKGKYRFMMSDGNVREGSFDAEFCK